MIFENLNSIKYFERANFFKKKKKKRTKNCRNCLEKLKRESVINLDEF